MSLNLERDIMPGDLIPALGNLRVVISLKTNNSQVNLEIKSCCLSPTVRLDEFNTTCCIFSRLPIDPHGIRLLPSILSKRASFTISLFQMINYSTAYLHCDLSVCLRNYSECERCIQSQNAHLGKEAGAIFSSTGNRISFGPVLKEADNSSFSETADDTEAMVVIISSVASCLLACLALFLVWMANRRCLQRSAYCWSRALCECQQNRAHCKPANQTKICIERSIII
ncbi:uromodulin-like 1 [Sinocyclocheilus anshuiensis]|uniref:uromodulin-like 1 n=1 Tax=Sinocyclocheilus anshuiensis TaxID=1608454 RepID=UPI0007B79095|nr:PREDICTED: uromodulin-like 1 [Sinocyclocheilus anshuiensis]